jgi:hypothetical protein
MSGRVLLRDRHDPLRCQQRVPQVRKKNDRGLRRRHAGRFNDGRLGVGAKIALQPLDGFVLDRSESPPHIGAELRLDPLGNPPGEERWSSARRRASHSAYQSHTSQ